MAVQTVYAAQSYTLLTGPGEVLTIPWMFLDDDHLLVTGNGTTLSEGTDYTVTGEGDESGGSLTMVTGSVSDVVLIALDIPVLQLTEYISYDAFPADTVEASLDRLTLIAQTLDEDVNRSLKAPLAAGAQPALPGTENSVVSFDANGDFQELNSAQLLSLIGVEIPTGIVDRPTTTWANSGARGTQAVDFTGQLGIQLSDGTLWQAASLTVGDWIVVPQQLRTELTTTRQTATPGYVNEIIHETDTSRLYKGEALTGGAWSPIDGKIRILADADNGADTNDGMTSPVKTISKVLTIIADLLEHRAGMDIHVTLKGVFYNTKVTLGPAHTPDDGYHVYWEGDGNAEITGAVLMNSGLWTETVSGSGIWYQDIGYGAGTFVADGSIVPRARSVTAPIKAWNEITDTFTWNSATDVGTSSATLPYDSSPLPNKANKVRVSTTAADLPNGLAPATDYYIKVLTATTFELYSDNNLTTKVTASDVGTGTHSVYYPDETKCDYIFYDGSDFAGAVTGDELTLFNRWRVAKISITSVDVTDKRIQLSREPGWVSTSNTEDMRLDFDDPCRAYYSGPGELVKGSGEWARSDDVLYYAPPLYRAITAVEARNDVNTGMFYIDGTAPGTPAGRQVFTGIAFTQSRTAVPSATYTYLEGLKACPVADFAEFSNVGLRFTTNVTFSACEFKWCNGAGSWVSEGCDAIRYIDCDVLENGSHGLMLGSQEHAGTPATSTKLAVVGCRLHDNALHYHSGSGVLLGEVNGITIRRSEFYNNPMPRGVQLDGSSQTCEDVIVEYNHFHDLGGDKTRPLGDAGAVYVFANGCKKIIIRRNTIERMRSNIVHADTFWNGQDSHGVYIDEQAGETLVENNYIAFCAGACIKFNKSADALVRRNVFVNHRQIFRDTQPHYTTTVGDIHRGDILDNICYSVIGHFFIEEKAGTLAGDDWNIDRNHYHTLVDTGVLFDYFPFSAWQIAPYTYDANSDLTTGLGFIGAALSIDKTATSQYGNNIGFAAAHELVDDDMVQLLANESITWTVDPATDICTTASTAGFTSTDKVWASTTAAGVLPAPMGTGTYYIKLLTGTTFEIYTDVALTSKVDFTDTGTGTHTLKDIFGLNDTQVYFVEVKSTIDLYLSDTPAGIRKDWTATQSGGSPELNGTLRLVRTNKTAEWLRELALRDYGIRSGV